MEQVSRALNIKTRRAQKPLFLVISFFFKRVKPPAQPAAAARMSHKLWRWYGPGRVLATETRTDGVGEVRKTFKCHMDSESWPFEKMFSRAVETCFRT